MEAPEASQALVLGHLAKLLNRELLKLVLGGQRLHLQQLQQLIALHHIVMLDAALLGELLQLDQTHRLHRRVHFDCLRDCFKTLLNKDGSIFGFSSFKDNGRVVVVDCFVPDDLGCLGGIVFVCRDPFEANQGQLDKVSV